MTDNASSSGDDPPAAIAPNFDVMRSIYGVGSGPQPSPSPEIRHDEAFLTMQSLFGVENDVVLSPVESTNIVAP